MKEIACMFCGNPLAHGAPFTVTTYNPYNVVSFCDEMCSDGHDALIAEPRREPTDEEAAEMADQWEREDFEPREVFADECDDEGDGSRLSYLDDREDFHSDG